MTYSYDQVVVRVEEIRKKKVEFKVWSYPSVDVSVKVS
jgi:hypothetical protein